MAVKGGVLLKVPAHAPAVHKFGGVGGSGRDFI